MMTIRVAAWAAPIVADLLSKCPRRTVLVTSRTALHLQAERRFMVEPLSVPRADVPHTLETDDVRLIDPQRAFEILAEAN